MVPSIEDVQRKITEVSLHILKEMTLQFSTHGSLPGTRMTKDFAGIFSRDGKTFETIEYPACFSDGTIVTADEIRFVFRDTNDPSRIAIDSFRRMT